MKYIVDAVRGILFDVCDELAEIDPCSCGDEVKTIEDDEIPLHDAVETCHRVAQKIEAIG